MNNSNTSFVIVDEQPDFIIVGKPAGANFHDEGDLGHGFFNHVKSSLACENLFPVHRLDKMTSGLVIFAKSLNAAREFQTLFDTHTIQKYYLALSDKKPKKKQGMIKGDMIKSRRSAWKLLRTTKKPAITQFMSYGLGNGLRLFIVKPHSGKTHQIRVALNSVGAPIIGDDIYYPNASNTKFDRGYLHAYGLDFMYKDKRYQYLHSPTSGEHFLTQPLKTSLAEQGNPWEINWPKI